MRLLTALTTLVVLELVRSSGPLLDMAFAEGVYLAAGAAVATYAAPGLLALALVVVSRRRVVTAAVVGVLALALARLAAQAVTAGVRFGLGLTAVALGVAVLTLVVATTAGRSARTAAQAIALGAAGAVGLQLALGTWDAYWRHDVLGWLVAGALGAALVVAAWAARGTAPVTPARGLWALGPVLALLAMLVANVAFATSQTRLPQWLAGAVLGLAWLGAAWSRDLPPWLIVLLLPALVGALGVTAGVAALLLLAVIPLVILPLLRRALTPGGSPLRAAGAASVVGLGTILPLLGYQIDYDIPLGFPNWLVLVATALIAGMAAARGARRSATASPDAAAPAPPTLAPPARLALASGTLLAVGLALAGARALPTEVEGAPDQLTVVNWNLHYGVDGAGNVGLEEIATAIAAQDPDVVLLQEVSRGWILGGGADMATWLAQRLDMQVAFAPAADRQFGNAILSRIPLSDISTLALPYGDGPQQRSALFATVTVADRELTLTSVHLQHRKENTPTRMTQISTLLDADPTGPWLVTGDFNAEPTWPEIALLTETFVSAVDVAGDPTALTSPSLEPEYRIDWVFGRGITFVAAEVGSTVASDHLPIVTELRLEPGS